MRSHIFRGLGCGLFGLSFLVGSSLYANEFNIGDSITVAESSVSPSEIVQVNITAQLPGQITYSGGAYAGINQLLINGSQTVEGFCIDPFHFSSSSSLPFTVVDLANAPKGDNMGSASAILIQRLWASYFSPTMSAQNAAGLQIAIWEVVDPNGFHLAQSADYGASGFLNAVKSLSYSGPVADNLVALTGGGQDYVVQSVPDGGTTSLLLGMGLLAVAGTGKCFRTAGARNC